LFPAGYSPRGRTDTDARRLKRQAFAEKAIDRSQVFPFGVSVARLHARSWATPAERRQAIGAHHPTIAATATDIDYAVVTANRRDFEKIEGVPRKCGDPPPVPVLHAVGAGRL